MVRIDTPVSSKWMIGQVEDAMEQFYDKLGHSCREITTEPLNRFQLDNFDFLPSRTQQIMRAVYKAGYFPKVREQGDRFAWRVTGTGRVKYDSWLAYPEFEANMFDLAHIEKLVGMRSSPYAHSYEIKFSLHGGNSKMDYNQGRKLHSGELRDMFVDFMEDKMNCINEGIEADRAAFNERMRGTFYDAPKPLPRYTPSQFLIEIAIDRAYRDIADRAAWIDAKKKMC